MRERKISVLFFFTSDSVTWIPSPKLYTLKISSRFKSMLSYFCSDKQCTYNCFYSWKSIENDYREKFIFKCKLHTQDLFWQIHFFSIANAIGQSTTTSARISRFQPLTNFHILLSLSLSTWHHFQRVLIRLHILKKILEGFLKKTRRCIEDHRHS